MSLFPVGAVTTVTDGITSAIADNIAVVLGILAFVVAVKWVFRLFNSSLHGKARAV